MRDVGWDWDLVLGGGVLVSLSTGTLGCHVGASVV